MPWGDFLMKKIVSEDGKTISLYPKKVYCCHNLKTFLEQMMLRPGFKKDLLADVTFNGSGMKTDIYDGKVWSEFQNDDGSKYFSDKRNIGLMLNFD